MNDLFAELKDILSAGFSSGKWQVQLLKLNKDAARVEKQRIRLVENLGSLAWENRVCHPSYQTEFSALEEMDEERSLINEEIQRAQSQIKQFNRELGRIREDYTKKIAAINQKKQTAATLANQARNALRSAEDRYSQAQKLQKKTAADISLLRSQLDQVTDSTMPDKETRVTSLNNAIRASQSVLADTSNQLTATEIEINSLKEQLRVHSGQVNEYELQIAGLQAEQKAALQPLENQIAVNQADLRSANEKLKEFTAEIQQMCIELGPAVEAARPVSTSLDAVYGQIDSAQQVLEKITSEIKGLKARLASRDEGLQRKFYWLIIGALGLLVFMVLMVLGIVYVMNSVLFPVNQITGASSIKEMKLLYSWPNKECAQNDKYAIINVWENTSSTPLQVYFENSLIGSDRAILNKTVSTAHFPPHAKSLDLIELDRKDSSVQTYRLTAIKSDALADEKTITDKASVEISPTVIPGEAKDVVFGVKLANKSSWVIESVTANAIVMDEKENPITILETTYNKIIPIDQEVTIPLNPFSSKNTYSCIPNEPLNFAALSKPVKVWYFVTYSLGSNTYGHFSDKATFNS